MAVIFVVMCVSVRPPCHMVLSIEPDCNSHSHERLDTQSGGGFLVFAIPIACIIAYLQCIPVLNIFPSLQNWRKSRSELSGDSQTLEEAVPAPILLYNMLRSRLAYP